MHPMNGSLQPQHSDSMTTPVQNAAHGCAFEPDSFDTLIFTTWKKSGSAGKMAKVPSTCKHNLDFNT